MSVNKFLRRRVLLDDFSFAWEAEYQAVLDYADSQTITTPSFEQNVINNAIVKNLKYEEVWGSFDLFYYFEQETGTAYEFLTLNWADPTKYRLTNVGVNDIDFIGGSGFKYTQGNQQCMSTNFNAFTDAVNVTLTEASLIYSLFDCQTTYVAFNRVLGCSDSNNYKLKANNEADGILVVKLNGNDPNVVITQADYNAHYHCNTNLDDERNTYINGDIVGEHVKQFEPTLPNADVYILGVNNVGVPYYSETTVGLKYMLYGGDLTYKDLEIYQIMNGTYYDKKVNAEGVKILDTTDITLPTIFWPQIYKSSDFPSVTTVKDWFAIWSTDHDPGDGGIYWGEMDDLMWTNFVERGKIIDGYQSETPHLTLDPDDIDGDILHLTYHPNQFHPSGGGYQQTRLLTTTGGLLHTATWTDRGMVLGIVNPPTTEDHTGYIKTYILGDTTLVGIHSTRAWYGDTPSTIYRAGKSTSVDGRLTWTRVSSDLDLTSYLGYKRVLHIDNTIFFTRDSNQYVITLNSVFDLLLEDQRRISIFGTDGSYIPNSYIGNISIPDGGNGCRHVSFYIDSDTLHIYYTAVNRTDLYHTTWNLTNLD